MKVQIIFYLPAVTAEKGSKQTQFSLHIGKQTFSIILGNENL